MSKPSLVDIKYAVATLYGIDPRALMSINKMAERRTFVHFARICRPDCSAQAIGEVVNFSAGQVSAEWTALSTNPSRRDIMDKITARLKVTLKTVQSSGIVQTMTTSHAPSKPTSRVKTPAHTPLTVEIATTVAATSSVILPELKGPMGDVIRFTLKEHSLSYETLASRSAIRPIVNARNTMLYLAREVEKISYNDIVAFFPHHQANGFSIKLGAFRRKLASDTKAMEYMLDLKARYLACDFSSLT